MKSVRAGGFPILALAALAPVLAGCNTAKTGPAAAAAQPRATTVAQATDANGTGTGTPADNGRVATPPVVETPATRDAAALQNAFTQVARVAQPAVVTITTERRLPRSVRGGGGGAPGPDRFGGRDPFEEFFRRFRGFGFEPSSAARQGAMEPGFLRAQERGGGGGLGSGLIYRQDGLILTNAHVVQGADEVTVKLADGREFENARVLGADARTDVAVVRIDARDLPTLALGDSAKVRVGDWAIAVGNPFGLEHTLTVGVISAKAREVPLTVSGPGDYLQTDASINPGNSGGPLLDIEGRVVGVNNAIFSRSGGNVGIGFAIPINTAREIADILVKEGRVTRAQLGVAVSNLEDRATAFGLSPDVKGVLIERVEPGGPGARAGLQPGDVVQSVNGEAVTRSIELQRLISRAPVGSAARLSVLRGGKTLTVTPRLEALEEEGRDSSPRGQEPEPGGAPAAAAPLGIALAPITPDLARRHGIRATRGGAVVVSVQGDSPAAAAGLRPGDVIERVGQTAVASPQAVQAAVRSILGKQNGEEKSVALFINRGGERQFVIIDVKPRGGNPPQARR